MSFGINLYNQRGALVSHGVQEEYMYWGKVSYYIEGGFLYHIGPHPVMQIPQEVPFMAFRCYDSMPGYNRNFQFYTSLTRGNGINTKNGTDLHLKLISTYKKFGKQRLSVYIFVPSGYIPDLEKKGIRVFNGNKKIWSNDRPMLKIPGYFKQRGSSCTLVAGTIPNRPAMVEGWGTTSNRHYNHIFNGSKLAFEWKDGYGSTNHDVYKPMIDRDYYDQFSSLGNWPY